MITKNLFYFINGNKIKFFKELTEILREKKLFEYEERMRNHRGEKVFSSKKEDEKELSPYFSISFCNNNLIYLSITVSVYEDTIVETKRTNFWGKEIIESQIVPRYKIYECRPFIFDYSKEVFGFVNLDFVNYIQFEEIKNLTSLLNNENKDLLIFILDYLKSSFNKYLVDIDNEEINVIDELSKINSNNITHNSNGLDIAFYSIVTDNQLIISELNHAYLHSFLKLSNFIKIKKEIIKQIDGKFFESNITFHKIQLINLLKNQIHNYNLIIFHSLSMVTSIVNRDLVTFFEIYESFNKLNFFNYNYKNDISKKITEINEYDLNYLIQEIYKQDLKIINEFKNLTYFNKIGFNQLENSVSTILQSIDLSTKYKNTLKSIQSFQIFKID